MILFEYNNKICFYLDCPQHAPDELPPEHSLKSVAEFLHYFKLSAKQFAPLFQTILLMQARGLHLRNQQTSIQKEREQSWIAENRKKYDLQQPHQVSAFPFPDFAAWVQDAARRYQTIPSIISTRQLVADFKPLFFIDDSALEDFY